VTIRKTVWDFDRRYNRCDPLDDDGQSLNYVYFEERPGGDPTPADPDPKPRPGGRIRVLILIVAAIAAATIVGMRGLAHSPGLFMTVFSVAVILLVTVGYGYLVRNVLQTQRDKTTGRREDRSATFRHN